MVQKIKIVFLFVWVCLVSSSYGEFMYYGIRLYSGGVDDHYYIYSSVGGQTLSSYGSMDTVDGYAVSSRVNSTYSVGAGSIAVRVKITDGISTIYDETEIVETLGDPVWIYPVRDVYILGAAPVPETDMYDFQDLENTYDELYGAIITLFYEDPVTGEMVAVDSYYSTGKASVLDPPFTYSWGSYELPTGITNWEVGYDYGTIPELGTPSDGAGVYQIIPADGDGYTYGGSLDLLIVADNPTVSDITVQWDGVDRLTHVGSGSAGVAASGVDNAPSSTNEAFNAAVEFAAGMRLAKPDITDAVRDGVSGLQSAIEGLDSGGGLTAVGVASGVLSAMGNDSGYSLPSESIDETGISTNIGTLSASGSISSMGTKMEAFIDALPLPSFPAGITTVSSVSFTLSGHSYSLDFNQPMWVTLRNVFEWMIHIFAFMGVLFIVRRGVA